MPKVRKEGAIPHLVIKTISYIYKNGLETEGIFRISGNKSEVLRIKKMFEKGKKVNLNEENASPHVCADVLKSYFRDLPEPIFTADAYHYFNSISDQAESLIITKIRAFFPLLPENNRMILIYLMTLLSKITEYSAVNKMTASNLAIVFTPNLIRTSENTTITTSALNIIIETLITHCDQILAEEEPEQKRINPIKRVKSADYSYVSSISKPVDPKKEFSELVNSDELTSDDFLVEKDNSAKVSFTPAPNFLGELKRMQSKKIEGARSAENLSRSYGSAGMVKQRAVYQPTAPSHPPKTLIKLDDSNDDLSQLEKDLSATNAVKSDTVLKRGEFKRGATFATTIPISIPRAFTTVDTYEKKIEIDGSHMKPVPPPRTTLSPRSTSPSTSPPSNNNGPNGKAAPPPVPPRKDKHRRSTSSPSLSFINANEQRNNAKARPVPPPRTTPISPPTSPRKPIPVALNNNNNNNHSNNHNNTNIAPINNHPINYANNYSNHNNINIHSNNSPSRPPPTPSSPKLSHHIMLLPSSPPSTNGFGKPIAKKPPIPPRANPPSF